MTWTLSEVKAAIHLDGDVDDGPLTIHMKAAESVISDYVGFDWIADAPLQADAQRLAKFSSVGYALVQSLYERGVFDGGDHSFLALLEGERRLVRTGP